MLIYPASWVNEDLSAIAREASSVVSGILLFSYFSLNVRELNFHKYKLGSQHDANCETLQTVPTRGQWKSK